MILEVGWRGSRFCFVLRALFYLFSQEQVNASREPKEYENRPNTQPLLFVKSGYQTKMDRSIQ